MRRELETAGANGLSESEAKRVLYDCMKVLYYRDARSLNKFSLATISVDGVKIEQDLSVQADWSVAQYVHGYGRAS